MQNFVVFFSYNLFLQPIIHRFVLVITCLRGKISKTERIAAYRLDRKSSVRFCLRIFFDLMDMACVNSYLIYNMKHPNKLFLLEGRTNPNWSIITEDIYQITKGCKNDARTVQWRVKKIEHSSSVWLVTFHNA